MNYQGFRIKDVYRVSISDIRIRHPYRGMPIRASHIDRDIPKTVSSISIVHIYGCLYKAMPYEGIDTSLELPSNFGTKFHQYQIFMLPKCLKIS